MNETHDTMSAVHSPHREPTVMHEPLLQDHDRHNVLSPVTNATNDRAFWTGR